MGHARKQQDGKRGKTINNLVAKHDHNKGGVHGKSNKAHRTNLKNQINQIDPHDEDMWDLLEEECN